ncbi:MAG TPA: SLC13 family permease, partial [Anaerolineae bacterium]
MPTAVSVFVISYILIASEKFPRQAVALLGAVALVLLNVFPLQEAFTFVDWETIGLLFGMF